MAELTQDGGLYTEEEVEELKKRFAKTRAALGKVANVVGGAAGAVGRGAAYTGGTIKTGVVAGAEKTGLAAAGRYAGEGVTAAGRYAGEGVTYAGRAIKTGAANAPGAIKTGAANAAGTVGTAYGSVKTWARSKDKTSIGSKKLTAWGLAYVFVGGIIVISAIILGFSDLFNANIWAPQTVFHSATPAAILAGLWLSPWRRVIEGMWAAEGGKDCSFLNSWPFILTVLLLTPINALMLADWGDSLGTLGDDHGASIFSGAHAIYPNAPTTRTMGVGINMSKLDVNFVLQTVTVSILTLGTFLFELVVGFLIYQHFMGGWKVKDLPYQEFDTDVNGWWVITTIRGVAWVGLGWCISATIVGLNTWFQGVPVFADFSQPCLFLALACSLLVLPWSPTYRNIAAKRAENVKKAHAQNSKKPFVDVTGFIIWQVELSALETPNAPLRGETEGFLEAPLKADEPPLKLRKNIAWFLYLVAPLDVRTWTAAPLFLVLALASSIIQIDSLADRFALQADDFELTIEDFSTRVFVFSSDVNFTYSHIDAEAGTHISFANGFERALPFVNLGLSAALLALTMYVRSHNARGWGMRHLTPQTATTESALRGHIRALGIEDDEAKNWILALEKRAKKEGAGRVSKMGYEQPVELI